MNKAILYLTNCYALPEQVSVGASTRHYYHVQALAQKGMKTDVVTASVSTISGERLKFEQDQPNVKVRDVFIKSIGRDTILARLSYHVRYFVKALMSSLKVERPDIVIASTPTLLICWIGYLVAWWRRAVFIIDVRDLWSDSLSTTSLARIPFFIKGNALIEKILYTRADMIYCTSQAQVEQVQQMVNNKIPVNFIPNGVDPVVTHEVEVHPFIQEIRKKYAWVGLFAGKHAKYTDLDNLLTAANELGKNAFALVLLGGGYTKESLKQRVFSEGIDNVFFHDPVPKSEVAGFEAGADIFFINYSTEQAWGRVLPNKTFDYMFWNKPIIAAVVKGEITRVIEKSGAGIGVQPGKPQAVVDVVRKQIKNGTQKRDCRSYLLEHFDRRKTVQRFCQVIEQVGGSSRLSPWRRDQRT